MRKKFVFFVLVPLVAVCIVVYLFIDRWVTSGLEAAGEAIVGAKVEIASLRVTLFPVGMEWGGMQVANPNDPWKNLFQTGRVRFAMDFGQLLRGKYIIETIEVNDFILGTKRTTDGSIPKESRPEEPASTTSFTAMAEQSLQRTVQQTPVFNLDKFRHGVNADSLIGLLNIQSVKYVDSLKGQVLTASRQWDASLQDVEDSKKRLEEIGVNLKAINPAALNGADKIMAAIGTVDNSVKSVNEIAQKVSARKEAVEGEVQKLSASAGAIDDIAKKDFQNLLQLAQLPNLSTSGIAQLLVGKEMYSRAMTYLSWIDMARKYSAKYQPAPAMEQPPRFKGQDIRFPVERSYPKLWIKKILISGGTDSAQLADYIRAKGEVRNITSNQKVTGVPLTVDLQGSQGRGRAFGLNALFDRTKDVPFDSYKAHLDNTPIGDFQLGKAGFLPSKVTNARLNSSVQVTVPGDKLDCRSTLDFSGMTIHFDAEPRNTAERLVRDVLKDIRGFDVSLRLWTAAGGMDVALATDLDDQIAARLKSVVGEEFTKLQNSLRAKLDARIAEKRQEFEKLFASKKEDVEKRLAAVQGLVSQNLGLVDAKKKELTEKLEKEKKAKVNDALKKLFK